MVPADKTTNQRPLGVDGAKALNPDEFGVILGLVTWLMSMSKEHKARPISSIDETVLPALLLKQFKLIRKDAMPVAFMSWATVSDEIKRELNAGDRVLTPDEWRSGKNIVIMECVSPFGPAAEIKEHFIKAITKTV